MNKVRSKRRRTQQNKSAQRNASPKPHGTAPVDSPPTPETLPKVEEQSTSAGASLSRAERLEKLVEALHASRGRFRPEALIASLKQQGIDVEVHQSRDGKGGQIVIIPPGARDNPDFTKSLREYFEMLDGEGAKDRP